MQSLRKFSAFRTTPGMLDLKTSDRACRNFCNAVNELVTSFDEGTKAQLTSIHGEVNRLFFE